MDRYYRPPHFWLQEEEDNRVRAGLASHVLRILSPIDEIITPRAGLHLTRDQPCGWIARAGSAIPLTMPVSGVVSAVNGQSTLPAAASTGDDSWLLRIDADESLEGNEGLLHGEDMLLWYLECIRTLKRYLREAIAVPAIERLGPLLADGGSPRVSLEAVLGPDRFDELLREIT